MGRICLLLAACAPVSEKTTEYFAISSFTLHAGLQIRRPAPTYPPVHLRLASRPVCGASLSSSPTYCFNFFFETPGFPSAVSHAAQTTGLGNALCQKKSINLRESQTPGVTRQRLNPFITSKVRARRADVTDLPNELMWKQRTVTPLSAALPVEIKLSPL